MFPLSDAMYVAFEAKKRAEMAGGVGAETDILIIEETGITEVHPKTVSALEDIYNERQDKTERRRFGKEITGLEIQRRNVETPTG